MRVLGEREKKREREKEREEGMMKRKRKREDVFRGQKKEITGHRRVSRAALEKWNSHFYPL